MRAVRYLAGLVAVLAALGAFGATGSTSIVILPPENVSGTADASARLLPLLTAAMEHRGWQVAHTDVEPILEEHRVRYLDALDDAVRRQLLDATGATAFMTGTVYTFRDDANPVVALSARVVDAEGRLLWGNVVGLTASDTEGLLGLGRVSSADTLARAAVTRLLDRLPRPGGAPASTRGRSKPIWQSGPPTFRSAAISEGGRRRVVVIPFDTASRERVAPRVISDVLSVRLASTDDFEVVDPCAVRAAARTIGLHSFAFISTGQLAKLGEVLGTTLFLRGSVYTWKDVPPRVTNVPPEVHIELSLVDAANGRILWGSNHVRKGDDYQGLLLLGTVSNAVTLTDRVISEMINAEKGATPRGDALAKAMPNQKPEALTAKGNPTQ